MDKFFSPEVQISGKIPSGDNMDDGIAAHGAFRGQVSKPSGKENLVSNSSPTRVEITITISTAILIKYDKKLRSYIPAIFYINCHYNFNPCVIFEKMTSFTQILNQDLEQGKLMVPVNSRK